MEILPAIDVRGGKCVRLVQGDYGRERIFNDDPVAQARLFADAGASRLHVVDLDGAREGRPVNDTVIARIVQSVPGMQVEVAGGVREQSSIDRWIDAGAHRVILGTIAVQQPDVVSSATKKHGERIAIAVDARDGKVAVKGWLETSTLDAADFMRDMAARGAQHFIYTDITRDGMMQHLDFDAFEALLAATAPAVDRAHVIYSGGVTSTDDLRRLATMNIEGAIVGTAIYDGRIDLREALAAAKA